MPAWMHIIYVAILKYNWSAEKLAGQLSIRGLDVTTKQACEFLVKYSRE